MFFFGGYSGNFDELVFNGSIANLPAFSAKQNLPDVVLFRRVILQAMIDAVMRPRKAKHRKWKREAITWIFESDNFLDDCEAADFDAERIRRFVRFMLDKEPPETVTIRRKKQNGKKKYRAPIQLSLFY